MCAPAGQKIACNRLLTEVALEVHMQTQVRANSAWLNEETSCK